MHLQLHIESIPTLVHTERKGSAKLRRVEAAVRPEKRRKTKWEE